jgi:hypothetical protein
MSDTATTRAIENLSPEDAAKIREALTPRVSTVFSIGRAAAEVDAVTDGSDRICLRIGSFAHYMSCESASLIGSDLLTVAVQLQAQLDLAAETAPEPDPFEEGATA